MFSKFPLCQFHNTTILRTPPQNRLSRATSQDCRSMPIVSRTSVFHRPWNPTWRRTAVAVALCAVLPCLSAQVPSANQRASADRLAVPHITRRPLGSADAGATAELGASKEAGGWTRWHGIQALGTIIYAPSTDALPVTLTAFPHNHIRLDVEAPEGHTIDIVNGLHEVTISPDGKKRGLAPEFVLSGVSALFLPAEDAQISTASLTDDGTVSVSGTQLHKINIDLVPHPREKETLVTNRRYVADLYFDPTTHLLSKVVAYVPVPGESIPAMLRVTSFEGYSTMNGVLFPTTITETLDGRLVSTIHINSVNPADQASAQLFSY